MLLDSKAENKKLLSLEIWIYVFWFLCFVLHFSMQLTSQTQSKKDFTSFKFKDVAGKKNIDSENIGSVMAQR